MQESEQVNWWSTIGLPIIIPIVIATAGAFISYFINRAKTKAEIKKLKADANKAEEEIKKIREETKNLKKSFQPIVIGTLQSVQEKVLNEKIEALKKLTLYFNQFIRYTPVFNEGEMVIPSKNEMYVSIFLDFQPSYKVDYMNFHNTSAFLFSDIVFKELDILSDQIVEITEKKVGYDFKKEMLTSVDDSIINLIDSIINSFQDCQLLMRKDCFLDTDFIHQFIEENKR